MSPLLMLALFVMAPALTMALTGVAVLTIAIARRVIRRLADLVDGYGLSGTDAPAPAHAETAY